MSQSVMSADRACHWVCRRCEVEGQSVDADPSCWNCGGVVRIKYQARVSAKLAPMSKVDL